MGSARDSFRVEYARTKSLAQAESALLEKIDSRAFDGRYFRIKEDIRRMPDGRIQLKAVALEGKHEVGTIRFELDRGPSEIEWHDRDPDD